MPKLDADQFDLPFDNPSLEIRLSQQWARNAEAQAAHWTPERLCLRWACSRIAYDDDGQRIVIESEDWEWWKGLHEYERHAWRQRYACRMPGELPRDCIAAEEEYAKRALIEANAWADEIRQAFKERRPCPIRIDSLEGLDRLRAKTRLDMAFQLAQIPRECFEPEKPEENSGVRV